MYIDTQLEFSDAQAVTSTAISSNVVDLFAASGAGTALTADTTLDIGQGPEVYLVVQTQTTATDVSSDATLAITLESATDAGLTSGAVVHFSTGTMAFATYATAGTRIATIALPHGSYKRYLGLRYTVASGPLTAGNFDAFLTVDPAGVRRTYKTGFTVQ